MLILPAEAAVKLLIDRLYPEDVKYPVILLSPDGSYGGVLKSAGYNTHEILNKICSITGAKPISSESDRADFAPDLHKIIEEYDMSVSDPDLLEEICSKINSGLTVNICVSSEPQTASTSEFIIFWLTSSSLAPAPRAE